MDIAGNLIIADRYNHRIVRYSPITGVRTTLAGSNAGVPGFQDGTGTNARFNQPIQSAITSTNVVFVSDQQNHAIRRISCSAGVCTVSTVAGSGTAGYAEGTGTNALFNNPIGITVDSTGSNLYVCDTGNRRIRQVVVSSGVTSLVSGSGSSSYAEGVATAAGYSSPSSLTLVNNILYVTDSTANRIRAVPIDGTMSSVATGSSTAGSSDGTGTAASFNNPYGITYSSSLATWYVSTTGDNRIRSMTLNNNNQMVVTTLAGSSAGYRDGYRTLVQLNTPQGMVVDSSGNLYVADSANNRIAMCTSGAGTIGTLTGTGNSGSSNGAATAATFNTPMGVYVDSNLQVWIADTANHQIRMVSNQDSRRIVSVVAGQQGSSGFVDGVGTAARFNNPTSITMDTSSNLYVADRANHAIRRIEMGLSGSTVLYTVTTWVGTGSSGSFDATGTVASFSSPYSIAFTTTSADNIYVADTGNHKIRRISISSRVVTTYCGTGSAGTASGTCTSTSATMTSPTGIAVDSSGNVYFSSPTLFRVYRISAAGSLGVFAGGSTSGYVDGVSTVARFTAPTGLVVDNNNWLYVSDAGGIRRVAAGTVATLAGTTASSAGFVDGTATSARFRAPTTFTNPASSSTWGLASLTADVGGRIYMADIGNHAIRVLGNTFTTLGGFVNGAASSSAFNRPQGIVVRQESNAPVIYVADTYNQRIRKIASGTVTSLSGNGVNSFADSSSNPFNVRYNLPWGLSLQPGSTNSIVVADSSSNRLRMLDLSTFLPATVLGSGSSSFSAGSPGMPQSGNIRPVQAAWDPDTGGVYVAEQVYNLIRFYAFTGTSVLVIFAGSSTATAGYADGVGTASLFRSPQGIALCIVGSSKWLVVGDDGNHAIRKISIPDATVTTLAGSSAGSAGFADGTGTDALFNSPRNVVCDSKGTVFVADNSNHRVRRVTAAGVTTTILGSGVLANGDGWASSLDTYIRSPTAMYWQPDGDRSTLWVVGASEIKKMTLTCADAPAGVSATITYSNVNRYHPVTATYTCATGTSLISGSATLDCDTDGTWPGTPAVCGAAGTTISVSVTSYASALGSSTITISLASNPTQTATITGINSAPATVTATSSSFVAGDALNLAYTIVNGMPSVGYRCSLSPTTATVSGNLMVSATLACDEVKTNITVTTSALPSALANLVTVRATGNLGTAATSQTINQVGTSTFSSPLGIEANVGTVNFSVDMSAAPFGYRCVFSLAGQILAVTSTNNPFTGTLNCYVLQVPVTVFVQALPAAVASVTLVMTSQHSTTGTVTATTSAVGTNVTFNSGLGVETGTTYTMAITSSIAWGHRCTLNNPNVLGQTQTVASSSVYAVLNCKAIVTPITFHLSPAPLPAALSSGITVSAVAPLFGSMVSTAISGTQTADVTIDSPLGVEAGVALNFFVNTSIPSGMNCMLQPASVTVSSSPVTVTISCGSLMIFGYTPESAARLFVGVAATLTPWLSRAAINTDSFAIQPTQLPTGLTFSSATGEISGTPAAVAANASYTVTATDASSQQSTAAFSLVVYGAPGTLSLSITVAGAIAEPATSTDTFFTGVALTPMSVTESTGTYIASYSVSPALPTGLSLSTTTGMLSGTPAGVSPPTTYAITATNPAGQSTTTVTFQVKGAPASGSVSLSLASAGAVADPATSSFAFFVNSALTSTACSVASGTFVTSFSISPPLPAGLSFSSSTGTLSGTPTASKVLTTYTITASNPAGSTTFTVSFIAAGTPSSLFYDLAAANSYVDPETSIEYFFDGVGLSTLLPFVTTGDVILNYTVSPALPGSMVVDPITGALSGTPAGVIDETAYIVTASNPVGQITATLRFAVAGVPESNSLYLDLDGAGAQEEPVRNIIYFKLAAFTPSSLHTANSNTSVPRYFFVNVTLTPRKVNVTTGNVVTAFTVSPSLPSGMSLSTTGVLSGTPSAASASTAYTIFGSNPAGSANLMVYFGVKAAPVSGSVSLNLTDAGAATDPATSNHAFFMNVPLTPTSCAVRNGTFISSFSISPALPAGLSFSSSTGTLSGTPTASAPLATYTITANNPAGTMTFSVSFVVADVPSSLSYNLTAAGGYVHPSTSVTYFFDGVAISSILPTVITGDVILSYTVSPALPGSMAVHSTTGALAGTPAGPVAVTTYTVTASNPAGQITATLSFAVAGAPALGSLSLDLAAAGALTEPVSSVRYFFKTAALTPTAVSVAAGSIVTAFSVSPSLPSGMSLSTSTGVLSGTPSAAVASAAYTITGSNPAGSTTLTVTFGVQGAPLSLVYMNSATQTQSNNFTVYEAERLGPLLPISSSVISYYVAASPMPAGLTLNSNTGVISGSPAFGTAGPDQLLTINATNPAGTAAFSFNLTILPGLALLGYKGFNGILYEAVPLAPTLQLEGQKISSCSNFRSDRPLPLGLVLNPNTGALTGVPLRATSRVTYNISCDWSQGVSTLVQNLEVIALSDPLHPARTVGDPHIVGFKGQKFDIQGVENRVYNMYSDSDVQLSVQLGSNPIVEDDENTSIVGISFRFGKRGAVVYTAKDNQMTISPRFVARPNEDGWAVRLGECGEIRHSADGLEVIYNQYHLKVNRRAYYIAGLEQTYFYFFNMEFSAFPTQSANEVDGILGQTFRLPAGVTPLGKNGEGVLEHPLSAYEVHGGLSSLNTERGRYRKMPGLHCLSSEFQDKLRDARASYSASKLFKQPRKA